ncbi:hypothetical protein HMPREF9120_00155 [Neisseria sp. oral taxon 020 str. F0370]|nr:hypothetical protein HMPREF9120_00155 [Neisseria sp. oral taxon 020 str. F0370]
MANVKRRDLSTVWRRCLLRKGKQQRPSENRFCLFRRPLPLAAGGQRHSLRL